MSRTIIAFCGYRGSGKTEAAKYLVARGFTRERFAGPLKQMLRVIGLTDEQLDGSLKETPCDLLGGKTPRFAMQTLGTEWRNLICENLWTNIWKHRVQSYPEHTPIVVDDLRFRHEYYAVRELGGFVVLLSRLGVEQAFDHASEDLSWTDHNSMDRLAVAEGISNLHQCLDRIITACELRS